MKPLLKWPGGKTWLAPYLLQPYRDCDSPRLVEPFAGGLSVALRLRPTKGVINDINKHLINLYVQIQRGGLTYISEEINEKDYYYERRNEFNALIKQGLGRTARAGELFYYLNHFGFNGLCRFNNAGEFNVPFGDMKSVSIHKDFSYYRRVFELWSFCSTDFTDVEIKSGDFLYVDPPYDGTFVGYSENGFTWDDQTRLALWCNEHDGPIVVSNSYTERIVELYKGLGFKTFRILAPRSISRSAEGRQPVFELLATRSVFVNIDQVDSCSLF